jgi:hypothetical protein
MKTEREIILLELPIPETNSLPLPHLVIIKFPQGNTVDIGALSYIEREKSPGFSDLTKNRVRGKARKVNLNSLNEDRKYAVAKLIRHISDEFSYSGKRPETVRDMINRFMPFMDWADDNGYENVLTDVRQARLAIYEYVKSLRERVNCNSISINGAARQQNVVLKLLEGFFDEDDFSHGINLLRTNPAAKIQTTLPDEKIQSKILALCESLFFNISNFTLGFRKYPYSLEVPEFINYPDNRMWIFPTTMWFKSPHILNNRTRGYNYKEGRIATLQELQSTTKLSASSDQNNISTIKNANYQIEKANNNFHDVHRLHQGMNALNFFIILFLSETGMNWAQLVNLTWSDDYEVSVSRQRFRIIKWRANNRDVFFELPTSFMPKFRQFLLLRKYLLQGFECEWLFFHRGCKRTSKPSQVKMSLNHTYCILKKIYPELRAVTARQWRAAKSDWLIRNTDPATTALILQNSEKTVIQSYAAGSETSQIEEVSSFLNEISKTVLSKRTEIKGGKNQSLGTCSDYGAPRQAIAQANIVPNCKTPEGCLFCDKFKVHADKTDTRKLISCRYCIHKTAYLAESNQNYEDFIIPVLTRINIILDEIAARDSNLVNSITTEVEEYGELDSYWSGKLEMLIDLGLIK